MTAEEFARKFSIVERAIGVRRTVTLATTIYLTISSYLWAAKFAIMAIEKTPLNEIGAASIGAIILAVLTPVTYLQKVVLNDYSASKRDAPQQEIKQ